MEHIKLHATTSAATVTDLEQSEGQTIPALLAQAKDGKMDLMGTLAAVPVYISQAHRLQQVDKEHQEAAMQFLLQVFKAYVQLGISEAITKVVRLGDQDVPHTTLDDLQEGIISWFQGYYYSMVARAEHFRSYLKEAEVQEWLVFEGPFSPFFQAHHQFLVGLGGDQDVAHLDQAENALEGIPATYRTGLEIYFPLWRPIIEKNQAAFDAGLKAALKRHIAYWGEPKADKPDHPDNPDGHFSYQLTGMMAYASEMGLKLNVSSDYTPSGLVNGDLQVEIETELDFYF